jgi:hypothetical protein
MKSTNWKDVAELIGIAAIVASLLFVGLQMQQEQEIAISETHSSVTQTIGALAVMMESSSDIWAKGLDGAELSIADQTVFFAMAEAVETYFINMYLRFFRLDIGDPNQFARNWAYALYIHPGLRRAYMSEQRYDEQRYAAFRGEGNRVDIFSVLVLEYLEQLDRDEPAIPSERRYVFW